MIGFITDAVKVVKYAKKVVPVFQAATESKDEIVLLYMDARQKWDSDGDGKPDVTPQEALDFLDKLFSLIAKRLG